MRRIASLLLALGIAALAAVAGAPLEASAQLPRVLPPELREEFRGMSAEEREQAREVLRALPAHQRARLWRAIRRWDDLTPEQREKVRGHAERLRRLSEERRERIERNLQIWQEMDRADRQRMRRRLERFRSLPAWQQEALVDERFGDRTADQRARILDRLRNR